MPSDLVARRATFGNWRLTAEQGFMLIIAKTEFQNRGTEHENNLEFHPNELEVESGLQKGELAVLLKGAAR
jgi:maltodextrin utilization protein YvdJ